MAKNAKQTTTSAQGFIVEDTRSPAERRWDHFTTIPLICLSFLFITIFTILILDDEPFRMGIERVLIATLMVIWLIFITDYLVRLILSNDKKRFIKKNVLDLFSVFIPFFRPFLLLVYLGRLRFFKGRAGSSVRARLVVYAFSFALMYIFVIALAVFAAERNAPGANIVSFGDSLWWAMVTIATVGYGDYYPVTVAGRIYATLLMLGGMVIVGAFTATIISYLNEQVQAVHQRNLEIAHQAHQEHEAKVAQKKSTSSTPAGTSAHTATRTTPRKTSSRTSSAK